MRTATALLLFAALPALAVEPSAAPVLRGYLAGHSAAEVQWEQKFRALPDPDRLRANMQRLTARPHHVGSPYDKDNAQWLLAQLRSFGLDAKIEQFEALFPTPKSRKLELLGADGYTAKLDEPVLTVDPTSGQKDEQLPTYNAYSRDGDVTAPLVYVNYGTPADYEQLDAMGVSVKGAIVIARYGKVWRGLKPKVASEHGAVGCIIYSDPRDDGYSDEVSYPEGPARPAYGVQRGSVMDMTLYPGDPQTPGVGAVPGVKLIPLDQLQSLTKIPVLPVSYADAKPFLLALGGQVVPESWRGGLPITYKTGPSMALAHLAVAFNWDRKPLYDVIATIPGSAFPDQWVIRGNHHDAWVNGAEDPVSGTSPTLEEARALGELLKQGWKPQRTIVYCFWDGEEPMLLGSTEWAEFHANELRLHAVAYFNSDSNGRGFFYAAGSHSLENFVNGVTKDIEDPETKFSVWKRARLRDKLSPDPDANSEDRDRSDSRIDALGSGSDYTIFVHHLGIPSVNLGFGDEDEDGGQYHSIYDDFYWYTHFSDTNFAYGKALAQTAGTMVMRLADADILPFQFADQAETVRKYIAEVKKLADTRRAAIKDRNDNIAAGAYFAAADPKKTSVTPLVEPVPPYFNFAPLDQAADDLTAAATACDQALDAHSASASTAVNPILMQAERALTDPEGLPGRPWYENLLYAPGAYTGYAPKTLPAIREAIEQKKWSIVDAQIARTAAAIEREAAVLKSASRALAAH